MDFCPEAKDALPNCDTNGDPTKANTGSSKNCSSETKLQHSKTASNPQTPDQSPRWGYGPWVGVLGLGVILDAKAQVLGDGVTANQPLPNIAPGTTNPTVPLKSVSRTGGIVVVSFSF